MAVVVGELAISLQEASDARCSQQLAVSGISHFYAMRSRTWFTVNAWTSYCHSLNTHENRRPEGRKPLQ